MGFWTSVGLVVAALAGAGTSAYSASASSTAQKKAAGAQEAALKDAALKEAAAKDKAKADAAAEVLKKRKSILESGGETDITKSVGVLGSSDVTQNTLLGG